VCLVETLTPDLVVRDRRGNPVAIAEVKNLPGLHVHEAEALREQIASYVDLFDSALTSPVRFLLVVSEETGFLWDASSRGPRQFSMRGVIDRYLPHAETRRPLREQLLEHIVRRWLEDVAGGMQTDPLEADEVLAQAGVASAVKGGHVEGSRPYWSST
jgi:hypothetical protein